MLSNLKLAYVTQSFDVYASQSIPYTLFWRQTLTQIKAFDCQKWNYSTALAIRC